MVLICAKFEVDRIYQSVKVYGLNKNVYKLYGEESEKNKPKNNTFFGLISEKAKQS